MSSEKLPDWGALSDIRRSVSIEKQNSDIIDRAVVYAKEGMRGRELVEPSPESLHARFIIFNPWYENLYVLLCSAMMILAQWEFPSLVATQTSHMVCQWVDAFCLVAIILDMCILQRNYYGPKEWLTKGWVQLKAIVLFLIIANTVISIGAPELPDLMRLLRPLLLIERKSTVRRIFNTIAKSLPRILSVAMLILIHVVTFSVGAFILFSGVEGPPYCAPLRSPRIAERCSVWFPYLPESSLQGCRAYFSSLEESLVHIFSMTTGAEFPGAMLPAMQCNPGYASFFILAFLTGNFFILRVTFAVVYDDSSTFKKEEIILRHARTFVNYDAAFDVLTGGGGGKLGGKKNYGADSAPPSLLPRERFVQFWCVLRPSVDPELAGLFFDSSDTRGKGYVEKDQFRKLCYLFSSVQGERARTLDDLTDDMKEMNRAVDMAVSENAFEGGNLAATLARTFEGGRADPMSGSPGRQQQQTLEGVGEGGVSSPNPLAVAVATTAAAAAGLGEEAVPASADAAVFTLSVGEQTMLQRQLSLPQNPDGPNPHHHTLTAAAAPRRSSVSSTALPPKRFSFSAPPEPPNKLFADALLSLEDAAKAYFVGNMPSLEDKLIMLVHHGVPTGMDPHGWQAQGLHFMHALPVHVFNELCGLLNAICVLCILAIEEPISVRRCSGVSNSSVSTLWIIYYVTFALFGLEIILLLLFTGPLTWIRQSYWNAADIVIFVVALMGTILNTYLNSGPCDARTINNNNYEELVAFALFCRLAKVLRVLRLLPGLERSMNAASRMIKPMARYLLIILCVIWSFSIVGNVYFGGRLGDNPRLINRTAYSLLGFSPLNFDTPLQGMVVMLQQLNVMEWPVVMEAAVAALDSGWPRSFFMTFWFVGVFVSLNIAIAFVVTGFSAERGRQERRYTLENAVLKELVAKLEEHGGGQGGGHGGGHGHGHSHAGGSDSSNASKKKRRSRMARRAGIESTVVSKRSQYELENRFRPLCAWREAIAASGKDFTHWRLSRPGHHLDIYGSMYHEDIEFAFPEVWEQGKRRDEGISLEAPTPTPLQGAGGHYGSTCVGRNPDDGLVGIPSLPGAAH